MVKNVVIRIEDKLWEKIDRLKRRHGDTWAQVLDKYVRMYR